LKNKAENEIRTLFQQRDKLRFQVPELQIKQTKLKNAIDILEKRKSRIEGIIKLDTSLLRLTLAQSLSRLKMERPDLFVLSEREQTLALVSIFMKRLFCMHASTTEVCFDIIRFPSKIDEVPRRNAKQRARMHD